MMNKLRVLDLFSGIGGFALGLERTGGFETVAFCEIDPFCRKVLAKHWPEVPCYEDVRTLTADTLARDGIAVDVITGGFPCQDLSVAGKCAGLEGERSGLWSEITRLAGELRPKFIIVENVANLLSGPSERPGAWFGRVLGDLAEIGFDAEWHVIPLAGLGAPHERERVYIIATNASSGFRTAGNELFFGRRFTRTAQAAAVVADHYRDRELQPGWVFTDQRGRVVYDPEWSWPETWHDKLSSLRGMDDALPGGLASATAKRFGNSVSPAVVSLIGRAVLDAVALPMEAAE